MPNRSPLPRWGKRWSKKARKIPGQIDALLASTRKAHGPLAGPLNLGVIPSLAPYLLPRLLPLVKNNYDRLQLVVHEDLTEHLLERLRAYRIDAALLALPLEGGNFDEIPLFDEPFWFACPAQHPLARLKSVSESDNARRRIGLVWRRGDPKAQEFTLLPSLSGTILRAARARH
jgi:LysR family hydrogen peroxide-inducible transcriptional activator